MTAAMAMRLPSGGMQNEPRSFATVPRRRSLRTGHWWGALVDDDVKERLIRQIEADRLEVERVRGGLSAHERECAQRYANIERVHGAMARDFQRLADDVQSFMKGSRDAAWTVNWRAWALAGAVIIGLLTALGWTAGQLYSLEPARVAAESKTR